MNSTMYRRYSPYINQHRTKYEKCSYDIVNGESGGHIVPL